MGNRTYNQITIETATWEGPPPPRRDNRTAKWAEVADLLRSRPGEWLKLGDDLSVTITSHIRRGRYKQLPSDEFEVTGRANATGQKRGAVYIRFVGKPGTKVRREVAKTDAEKAELTTV